METAVSTKFVLNNVEFVQFIAVFSFSKLREPADKVSGIIAGALTRYWHLTSKGAWFIVMTLSLG